MATHSRVSTVRDDSEDLYDVALESSFDFRSSEYRNLYARSHATAFQAPEWLALLYNVVAPARSSASVIVTVRERSTYALKLVLPLIQERSGGLAVLTFADFGLSDYTGAIYDQEEITLLSSRAVVAAVRAKLPKVDLISLTKLRAADPLLLAMFPAASLAQMRVSAHATTIDLPWQHWRLEVLDGSLRRELDLKRRRFSKVGALQFSLVENESEVERAFLALRKFRFDRFQQRGAADIMAAEDVFSFYKQVAIEGLTKGMARTYWLNVSGEPAAVMFGLVKENTFSLLLVGFDLANYRRYSVGLLAIEDTLRVSFESGDKIFDFTIGDYPWKSQLGTRPTPLYELHLPVTPRGRLAKLSLEAAREVKRLLKPAVVIISNKISDLKRVKSRVSTIMANVSTP